jgi:hypothetical protein
VRLAATSALVVLVAAGGAAAKDRSARMQVVATVVSSARLEAKALAGTQVEVRSRALGGYRGGAVLVHQRSGAPVALDGAELPRDASAAIVVPQGPLPLSASGPAEVVVTLFPDGAPPGRGEN